MILEETNARKEDQNEQNMFLINSSFRLVLGLVLMLTN